MHAKEHEEKKEERKEIKDSPYFQIKDIHPKERVVIKGVQKKYFSIRKISKFHTLALLDQSV